MPCFLTSILIYEGLIKQDAVIAFYYIILPTF